MTATNRLNGATESEIDIETRLSALEAAWRASGFIVPGPETYQDTKSGPLTLREAMAWDDRGNPHLIAAGRWAEKFVRQWRSLGSQRPAKAVLQGRTGCGKTHLARFVARACRSAALDVWEAGRVPNSDVPGVKFLSWKIMAVSGKEADAHFEDVLNHELPKVWVVVIDDFGAEIDRWGKGEPNSRFQALLDACDRKRVFATTNVPTKDWPERFGARVSSRLSGYHTLEIPDSVPDYRALKAK